MINGAAKLNWQLVREIRRLYAEERWTQSRLSREFAIGISQVGKIVRGEAWREESMQIFDYSAGSRSPSAPMIEAAAESAKKVMSLLEPDERPDRGEILIERMLSEAQRLRDKQAEPDRLLNELKETK